MKDRLNPIVRGILTDAVNAAEDALEDLSICAETLLTRKKQNKRTEKELRQVIETHDYMRKHAASLIELWVRALSKPRKINP